MSSVKTTTGIVALILLHLVWLIVPITMGLEWMSLSPLLLLMCCFVVGFFHATIDARFLIYIGSVYVASFVLSLVGVSTGSIFGAFFYGQNLGVLLWDTPLMIGVLWLLLCYCSSVTASAFTLRFSALNKPVITALLASVIVLAADVLLEQSASFIDFWFWKYREAPVQNYSAWFVFAFAFNFLFQQLEVNTNNTLARWFLGLFMLWLIGINVLPAYSAAH